MNSLNQPSPSNDDPFGAISDGASEEKLRIPLLEEELSVTTQRVETGRVTLTKTVHETEETVTIPLQQEHYVVERTALNQYVDEPPLTRQEGDTTVYPVVKEVLVVQKRLLLVEEIRVTRQQTQVEESQTVRLRREELAITRTPTDPERPDQSAGLH